MSESDTRLFDRTLLRRRRGRAARHMEKAAFLLDTVAAELCERIAMIKREFAVALDLGSHTGALTQAMSELPNVGLIIRADPVAALLQQSSQPAVVCEEDALPFADQSLESRPAEWKMAYRAGKPATDAARAFAQTWLADLEKAGVKQP